MVKTSLLLITVLGIGRTVSSPVQARIIVPDDFEDPGPAVIDVPTFVPGPVFIDVPPFVPIPSFPPSVFPPVVTTAPSKIVTRSSYPSDQKTLDSAAATIIRRSQATNAATVDTEKIESVNKQFA